MDPRIAAVRTQKRVQTPFDPAAAWTQRQAGAPLSEAIGLPNEELLRLQQTALQLVFQGHLVRAKSLLRQLLLLGAPPKAIAVIAAEYLRRQGRPAEAHRLVTAATADPNIAQEPTDAASEGETTKARGIDHG